MKNANIGAARIQLGALLSAQVLAILIALGITIGAFTLSFSVQRDLARQATIPDHLTWIFPAIVDSAIFGSTIAIVVLNRLQMSRWDKGFYIALAGSVVAVSVLGNAYHAFYAASYAHHISRDASGVAYVPPVVAALIAVIPPALVLAFTHGIGILIKATGVAYGAYLEQIKPALEPVDVGSGGISRGVSNEAIKYATKVSDNEDANGGYDTESVSSEEISENDVTGFPEMVGAKRLHEDDLKVIVDSANLTQSVKETVRLKAQNPAKSWEDIGDMSQPNADAATVMRRFGIFERYVKNTGYGTSILSRIRDEEAVINSAMVN